MVNDRFPQIGLIVAETNLGFSAANNLALRQLGFGERRSCGSAPLPRFVLLLNADTVLPPAALAEMILFMDERPKSRCSRAAFAPPGRYTGSGLPAQLPHTLGELLPHDPS